MTARPASQTSNKQIDPNRRGLIGKIHVAKAQLHLDEDTYRDVLRRVTGKESSADCSLSELEAIKAAMINLGWKPAKRAHPRAGKRPLADGELAAKLRALWISGYHLGVVADPAEAALAAFVKRVTGGNKNGVDALQWMTAADARKAIEGLKAWLSRDGGVDWDARQNPRAAIVVAQHRILINLGPRAVTGLPEHVLRDPTGATGISMDAVLWRLNKPQLLSLYSDDELDALIDLLGGMIRAARAKA